MDALALMNDCQEGPITTVQHHILQEQRRFPEASGEFSWLLSGITLATKMIAAKVRRAGLSDLKRTLRNNEDLPPEAEVGE